MKRRTVQLKSIEIYEEMLAVFLSIPYVYRNESKTTHIRITYALQHKINLSPWEEHVVNFFDRRIVDYLDKGVLIEVDFCGMVW